MTADVFGAAPDIEEGEIDPLSPEHVVSLVQVPVVAGGR